MRLLALLLPVLALLVVGMAGGIAYFAAEEGPTRIGSDAPAVEREGVAPTPGTAPRLAPESTVCQGILHRPDASAPRSFPAVYTQRAEAKGITIVGSAEVDEKAFAVAEATIERMFENNRLNEALIEQGAYVVIADSTQGILDLPEFACLEREFRDGFFDHVCGVADQADYPVATVNELDLLGDRDGPCLGLNILYHELGHLVNNWSLDVPDYYEIPILYQQALNAGKYRGQYAATNPKEYFAEATQAYFHHQEPQLRHDREWLESYDPELFALLDRVYGR